MSDVLLHDLNQRLQTLIADENLEFAFSLGRHILRHWPRHLDTYTQLGQAALAAGLYADAADLLRRALSANPEEGTLWAALEQATTALGLEDEAAVARSQARDLQSPISDDGSVAIRHLRPAYDAAPDRIPTALALATAYSHLGQHEHSRALAEQVLTQLPYCLKAHLLVVRSIEQTGDSAANGHVKIARELDPDGLYAWRWFGDADDPASDPSATLPPWTEPES